MHSLNPQAVIVEYNNPRINSIVHHQNYLLVVPLLREIKVNDCLGWSLFIFESFPFACGILIGA